MTASDVLPGGAGTRTAPAPAIRLRDAPPRAVWALEQAGVPPLLARLFAGRGVRSADELDDGLARLLPPAGLLGVQAAARLLADAIAQRRRVCVIADYDCDGATACAVALRGLRLLGAAPETLHYVVPDRAVHGYGLTPAIVDLALEHRPDLLLTVDNGIASLQGVAHARAAGIDVLVTDHHLPALQGDRVVLPDANVIVNPNQPGCSFESKHLAGVGVMFYVLLALRAELRERGAYSAAPSADANASTVDARPPQPRLDALLDLVALGTVADVVRLDANNRRLVAQGLRRIRAGQVHAGVAALFGVAARDPRRASGFDFGFALGPRINAAGRLSDMTLGIECLLTDDPARAAELAALLDKINRERREVESGMREQAEAMLERLLDASAATATEPTQTAEAAVSTQSSAHATRTPSAVAIFDEGFHEGVVGIVASRLKDRMHRPTFVFARGQDGLLKGSGRSIAGFHLRDALDLLSKRHPEVLVRFGGHAMAAGCTLAAENFETFDRAFQQIAAEWLDAATLSRTLLSDGPLGLEHFNAPTVRALDAQVWGQAFEAPVFVDAVEIISQRIVGEKHLKLALRFAGEARGGALRDAIWFNRSEPVAASVRLAYRLGVDEYNGRERVQMIVEGAHA